MAWYAARRLLQLIPVFFGATLLIYAMVFIVPGDPIRAMFGDITPTQAQIDVLREQFNLDQPFRVRYFGWLGGFFTGDLGMALNRRPVIDMLLDALPVTIKLAVLTLIIEAVAGVVVGLVSGIRKGGIFDSTFLFISLLVIAVPTFVTGFLAQVFFGVRLQWFPVTVGADVTLRSLLMPALVLSAISFALILRLTRTTVAENRSADYVRTATAKGLPSGRVMSVHVLRNSLIPVVTFLGADLGAMMGGAVITEGIFNIRGVGRLLFDAIHRGDGPVIVSVTTFLVIVYMFSNLLVDLLYAVLDPRIRYA
ncbi:MAG: ABC transporter permease [Cellulomonadaceae bacterium]|nr:ABC transporter permease [Cellulomonadaceae bacterium]